MSGIRVACYGLMVSALVLTGVLGARLLEGTSNEAQAAMVITQADFTMLTARTRSNEESMFLLDNQSGNLLIYRLDPTQNELLLAGSANMANIFTDVGPGDQEAEPPRERRAR